VLAAIKLAITDLERFPKIGIPIDASARYRLPLRHYPYLVFYRIAAAEVFILHIRHGARKPVESGQL
jgi:plasmid stabilization system protein ParE